MERAKVLQEIRNMRFEELLERQQASRLTQEDMAEVLDVDVRTVRRWVRRYEDEGVDGLIDKRIGQVSARRAPVDQVGAASGCSAPCKTAYRRSLRSPASAPWKRPIASCSVPTWPACESRRE